MRHFDATLDFSDSDKTQQLQVRIYRVIILCHSSHPFFSPISRLFTMVFDMLSCLLADGRFLNEQPTMPTSDEPGRKASIPILKRLKV